MRKLRLVLFVVFVAAIGLVALPASADVTGSSVTAVTPGTVDPGQTLDITFSVTMVSAEPEFLDHFDITLPSKWTINSVTPNAGAPGGICDEDGRNSTSGQTVTWEAAALNDGCGPYEGTATDFTVNVTVVGCAGAPWDLPWNISGDTWIGVPLHDLSGSIQVACNRPAAEVVEEVVVVPVPGCDALITMPSNAVGAAITADTPVYWQPGSMSDETFPADLHVLALGVDESGAYTKVLYVCGTYWVPTSVIGPNYDSPWNGAALPTDVVG